MSVLYAGSLVNLMEKGIGPAFQKQTGISYQGQGAGSVALANAIKDKTKFGDVFVSADPVVNKNLMGSANGAWLDAYVLVARTTMVVGYNPKSSFAGEFDKVKNGALAWYQVLEEPGLRLGRTDPNLDPKGYRTLFMFDLAEAYYHQPGLRAKLLGADENAKQVFPEETLESRLETGALDAGVFYLNEAAEKHLPYITLPDEVNQGNPDMAAIYAKARYTNAKGRTFAGGPIIYTAGTLNHAKDPAAGRAFLEFLLSGSAQAIMKDHGLLSVPALYGGDKSALPAGIQPLLKGTFQA
ncbi:MAG: extracellular solute-binding protein [Chloroflexota bacterium]|nr:extracellular solute-binding protein [Chloroflexota bacterium]